MSKVIDQAVERVEKPKEKKRKRDDSDGKSSKKRKVVEEEEEMVEDVDENEKAMDELRRKELKRLVMKYPDVSLDKTREVDERIKAMTSEQVKEDLNNLKIEIGAQQPGETALSIVGFVGLMIQKYTGDKTVYERFTNDHELVSAVDQICPSIDDYLTVPLKIAHRVGAHLSSVAFDEKPVRIME